jgi:hypothetical protein
VSRPQTGASPYPEVPEVRILALVWPGAFAPATVKPRGGGDDPVPRHAYAAMGFVSAGRQGVFERS